MRPSFYPQPIDIPLEFVPSHAALGHAPLATIVRADLLDLLKPHLPDIIVGRCTVRGTTITEYVTAYVRVTDALFYRGPRGCRYRQCPHCKYLHYRYDNDDTAPRYITIDQLRGRHAGMFTSHGTFLITPQLKDAINWQRFPSLTLDEIPVLSEPLDQLIIE